MPQLDFNCDLGEGCGNDAAIVPLVSSASIACGGHAGDAASMHATVALCLAHGVAIGAHPSFEDREHFGRRELGIPVAAIHASVKRQVEVLASICAAHGARVNHVKPHGALYNLAARDRQVADAIAVFSEILRVGELIGVALELVGPDMLNLIALHPRRGHIFHIV